MLPTPAWPLKFAPQHLTVLLSSQAQVVSYRVASAFAVRPVPRLIVVDAGDVRLVVSL